MTRKYDSSRRRASAARTRADIVKAAVRMHGQNVLTLAPVAEEAGVSLPTLYKHFPTREDLFGACTAHLGSKLDYPDLEALGRIENPDERIREIVTAACRLNEQTIGQAWTGYLLESESEAMANAMTGYEGFMRKLAKALFAGDGSTEQSGSPTESVGAGPSKSPPESVPTEPSGAAVDFAAGLLSPLTYRALRVKAGMDFDDVVHHLTRALRPIVSGPSLENGRAN